MIPRPPIDPGKPSLMVVDDEESVRTPLNIAFKSRFNIFLCRNSAEALATIGQHSIDVAIVDIKMTGESGLDLLKKLKATDPLIEVIVLTGFATMDYMKTAWHSDAVGFLEKPFDIPLLTQMLDKALRLRASVQQAKVALDRAKLADTRFIEIQNGVIHDLRNVLTVATGFMTLFKDDLGTRDRIGADEMPGLREAADHIKKQIDLGVALCSRHMRILRSVVGNPDAVVTEAPDQVINDLAGALRAHGDVRHASYQVAFSTKPLPAVRANPVEFFQILLNLAINAGQSATPPPSVLIEGRVVTAPLQLDRFADSPTTRAVGVAGFDNTPPFLAVTVSDNGAGIPPEILGRLFREHYTSKARGTGAGLRLVGELVAVNRGLLHLETKAGRGTTVTLYFRCHPVPSAPSSASP